MITYTALSQDELYDYLGWLLTLSQENLLLEKKEQQLWASGNEEMLILVEAGHDEYGPGREAYEHEWESAQQRLQIIEMVIKG